MTVTVLATGLQTPGGPAFDPAGQLWCAERTGHALICYRPDGQVNKLSLSHQPHTVAIDSQHRLWFSDGSQQQLFCRSTPTADSQSALARINGLPLNHPADLLIDPIGNVLLACPGQYNHDESGYVLALTPTGLSQVVADGLTWPLSLALTDAGRTLLIAETYQQRIWAGFWDPDFISWENIRVWANLTNAPASETQPGAGGLAVGPDGRVYLVAPGLPQIQVFSPEGVAGPVVDLPGRMPTGCCVDPLGRFGLIVTDATGGALLSCRD